MDKLLTNAAAAAEFEELFGEDAASPLWDLMDAEFSIEIDAEEQVYGDLEEEYAIIDCDLLHGFSTHEGA